MSIDLTSKDGQDKFIKENLSNLIEGINNAYGPILLDELMTRLRFTINEFNNEIQLAFKDLSSREVNRQKMYNLIKSGDFPENIKNDDANNQESNEWIDKIDEIESKK